MIIALGIAFAAALGGSLATYHFDRRSPTYARFATGVFVGWTVLAFVAFGFALVLGMTAVTLILATAATLIPAIGLRSPRIREAIGRDVADVRTAIEAALRAPTSGHALGIVYVSLIVLGVWLVADRNFFETPEGLFIGNVNNLGDLPYHLQITASFAWGDNFPPQNPVYAGSGFSYHYIADLLAAVFVVAGASLVEAMLLLNVALGLALLALIHRWARDLTGSLAAARVAPLLLAFSGGLGWLRLLDDARVGERGLLSGFTASEVRYTIEPGGLMQFGNAVTTLLIPQRGLLLGMGLAVIVFTLLWHHLDGVPSRSGRVASGEALRAPADRSPMIVAGALTGLLPLVHIHTFGVVLGTAFLLGVIFREWRDGRWKGWAVYVASTLLIALPILAWTARGSRANLGSFFGIELGWMRGANDPLFFWLANAGVFIPLVAAAFVWGRNGDRPLLSRKLLLYSLPFMVWFIVPNFLRLAPWLWDNIKVLIYWWLGAVPLVALLLARVWQVRPGGRLIASLLAIVLMTAGGLDIARATFGQTYQEFDPDGIAFARLIRERTPPSAVVLTAAAWNTPVFLSGRPVFMGYAGFLFGNGLPYGERETELRAIYAGEPGATELLQRHDISYIVVGPHERSDLAPNEEFLDQFPVVARTGDYVLYDASGS